MPTDVAVQRREALRKGNRVRLERRARIREIRRLPLRASQRRAAELLEHPPACMANAGIEDVVLAVRRIGPETVGHIFDVAGVALERRLRPLGALTDRERRALAAVLRAGRPYSGSSVSAA